MQSERGTYDVFAERRKGIRLAKGGSAYRGLVNYRADNGCIYR